MHVTCFKTCFFYQGKSTANYNVVNCSVYVLKNNQFYKLLFLVVQCSLCKHIAASITCIPMALFVKCVSRRFSQPTRENLNNYSVAKYGQEEMVVLE